MRLLKENDRLIQMLQQWVRCQYKDSAPIFALVTNVELAAEANALYVSLSGIEHEVVRDSISGTWEPLIVPITNNDIELLSQATR